MEDIIYWGGGDIRKQRKHWHANSNPAQKELIHYTVHSWAYWPATDVAIRPSHNHDLQNCCKKAAKIKGMIIIFVGVDLFLNE
jgi:hypothetical protein